MIVVEALGSNDGERESIAQLRNLLRNTAGRIDFGHVFNHLAVLSQDRYCRFFGGLQARYFELSSVAS